MKNESQLKSSKRGVLLRLAIFMALMISAFLIPSSALADQSKDRNNAYAVRS